MIQVAKASDNTYSYIVKMPSGEVVIGGDGCESVDEVKKFFADITSIVTDTPCESDMIHVAMVDIGSIDLPESPEPPKVTPEVVYPLGGTDMTPKKMSAPQPKKRKSK